MKLITDPAVARAVTPRPAATTLVVRDSPAEARLEVLMVRRSMQASFMPGAHVFPGGAVDAADAAAASAAVCDESTSSLATRIGQVTGVGALALGFAVAALRECFEECGLWLMATDAAGATMHEVIGAPRASLAPTAPTETQLQQIRARLHAGEAFAALAAEAGWTLATSALLPWSHWVTPLGLPKRFDTLFFIAEAPRTQMPSVDAGETTSLAWVQPGAALAAHAQGHFQMEFATVSTVQSLAPFEAGGVAALRAHAATLTHLPALHPRLQWGAGGSGVTILLPGQPGYDTAVLQ